jgi:hypothetical protein
MNNHIIDRCRFDGVAPMSDALYTPQGAMFQNNSNLVDEEKGVLRASNEKIKQHIGFINTLGVVK